MSLEFMIQVSFAGFLATFIHMVFAQWADRFGLPRIDLAKDQAELTLRDTVEGPSAYWMGLIILHLLGIVLAFVYAALLARYLPGPPVVKGMIWGGILFVGAMLFYVPVFFRLGLFAHKAHPRAWMTALLIHGLYGAILGWMSPIQ